MPGQVRAGRDEVAVHGPVVVLAEGEAVGRVVVVGFREGDEVGGVDEGDVVAGGELDAEAAGGALVVVDIEDEAAEGGPASPAATRRRHWLCRGKLPGQGPLGGVVVSYVGGWRG
jgi:hypothetical protein